MNPGCAVICPVTRCFPGVLLVEAAAQLAGVVAQNDPVIPPLPGLKLTALRNVKILGTARPGETVRLQARITGRLGSLVQAQVSAYVAAAKVLSAELTLSGTRRQPGSDSAGSGTPELLVGGPAKDQPPGIQRHHFPAILGQLVGHPRQAELLVLHLFRRAGAGQLEHMHVSRTCRAG